MRGLIGFWVLITVLTGALPGLLATAITSGIHPGGSSLPVSSQFLAVVAFAAPAILWPLVALDAARRRLSRHRLEPKGVPQYERELPSPDDPALVAALLGLSKMSPDGVAGTVLSLAERNAVTIEETGPRTFTLTVKNASAAANPGESIVLEALAAAAGPDGRIDAPPLWRGKATWWRAYRRDALGRAVQRGLLTHRFRRGPVLLASIMTGIGLAIFFTLAQPALFLPIVLLSIGAGLALAARGGLELTSEGAQLRAHWQAFGRQIADFTKIDEAPPATIALWGPYLSYGAALGLAKQTATALSPDV